MSQDNFVMLAGNLTRDPELRFTPSGTALVNFAIAVNRRFQQDGEWKQDTQFFNVKGWAQLAENVAGSFSKGDRVTVTGRLEEETWEGQDGAKRSKMVVVADDVAASARWAQMSVERTSRHSGDSGERSSDADRRARESEEPF